MHYVLIEKYFYGAVGHDRVKVHIFILRFRSIKNVCNVNFCFTVTNSILIIFSQDSFPYRYKISLVVMFPVIWRWYFYYSSHVGLTLIHWLINLSTLTWSNTTSYSLRILNQCTLNYVKKIRLEFHVVSYDNNIYKLLLLWKGVAVSRRLFTN